MGTLTSILNNDSLHAALQDKKLQGFLYQELRIIARAKLNAHVKSNDLNTTALVHEAFIKLSTNSADNKWHDRRHFYATAALTMRHILVDHARRRLAEKRAPEQASESADESTLQVAEKCQQLVALDDALMQLKDIDGSLVELVNLRYFVGLNVAEIATLMGVSKRTIDRQWLKAKALLAAWLS